MEYGITANISGLKCDNSACDYKDKISMHHVPHVVLLY